MAGKTEHSEQGALIEWARYMANTGQYPELKYLYAIVNEREGEAARIQAHVQGLVAGVPDLCLPAPRGGYPGLYIEMKWGKNTTTPDQEDFLAFLKAQGYKTAVCYGFEVAQAVLEDYLGLPSTVSPG